MPSKLDTLSFLEKCFGEYQLSNAGLNASVVCPICKEKKGITYDKKKLVIRTTDFALHCWVCGYKSKNLYKLIYTYRKSLLKEYIEKFQDKTKIVNQDFISGSSFQEKIETLIFGNKTNKNESVFSLPSHISLVLKMPQNQLQKTTYLKAQKYLFEKRKLTEQQIWDNNLAICYSFKDNKEKFQLENRIIFPSLNEDLSFDFYTARLFVESDIKSKYTNSSIAKKIIFNHGFIDTSFKEVTLVEGPFDYICSPYKNTVPILGSSLEHSAKISEWLFEFKPNVLRISLDKNETKKSDTIAQNLSILRDFGTKIIIANITHNLAKDFAELQELGIENKLDFVEEFVWYPKTKKERLFEKLT
jgi:hypothetical protein